MAEIRKIVLILEYRGANYCGFQWQKGCPTIQGELEEAIWRLTGERLRIVAASRTDTGVHARGQVVAFRTVSGLSTETFISGLNHYLPRDIAVKAAYQADNRLNIQKEAVSREYKYYILNSRTRSPLYEGLAYLVKQELDINRMNEAAGTLQGEHDFISFASALEAKHLGKTLRRVYRADVEKSGEMVVFTMVASSFLPHQVRNTVGSLLRVGLGRMSMSEFCSIMDAKKPALAGPAAPACGLYLIRVSYPFSFEEKRDEDLQYQGV